LPIFVLLAIIAIYDYIAVFKTKHMVFLANNIIDKNTLFVMDYGNPSVSLKSKDLKHPQDVESSSQKDAIPTQSRPKDHLHLGTGDFALPLLGVMTLFAKSTLWGLIAFFACVIALEATILLLFSKKHIALPAIPLQAIALLLVLGVYYLVLFI
jgi:presenilin-like A22 family membrane protease